MDGLTLYLLNSVSRPPPVEQKIQDRYLYLRLFFASSVISHPSTEFYEVNTVEEEKYFPTIKVHST